MDNVIRNAVLTVILAVKFLVRLIVILHVTLSVGDVQEDVTVALQDVMARAVQIVMMGAVVVPEHVE